MTRELFVSSTPHETKVGMVEDDLLAEIYLERENEYTLAGSIYKGRVTRVLPGMQSAFVDIGLERDAFLYVSDFMELENQEEDLDEIPAGRGVPDYSATVPEPVVAIHEEAQHESNTQSQSASPAHETISPVEESHTAIFENFPQDEPLFAEAAPAADTERAEPRDAT